MLLMVQVALGGLELSNAVVHDLPATAEPMTPLLSVNRPKVAPTNAAPTSSVLMIFTAPGWRGSASVTSVVVLRAMVIFVSATELKPAGVVVSRSQYVPAGRMLLMVQVALGGLELSNAVVHDLPA